jgi:hypothetical protein
VSREKLGIERNESRLCDKMSKDINERGRLEKEFPGITMVLYYEDVAGHIEQVADNVYRFIEGRSAPKSVIEYFQQTPEESGKEHAYGITRKEPKKHSYQWREEIHFDVVKSIDRNCAKVYEQTRYLPIRSEPDLRNLSVYV